MHIQWCDNARWSGKKYSASARLSSVFQFKRIGEITHKPLHARWEHWLQRIIDHFRQHHRNIMYYTRGYVYNTTWQVQYIFFCSRYLYVRHYFVHGSWSFTTVIIIIINLMVKPVILIMKKDIYLCCQERGLIYRWLRDVIEAQSVLVQPCLSSEWKCMCLGLVLSPHPPPPFLCLYVSIDKKIYAVKQV